MNERERPDDRPVDERLQERYGAAYRAVKNGEPERLRTLLAAQPELAAARSVQGRTLLHHLCDWPGHYPHRLETARILIDAGADVNACAIDPAGGETALQWAASNDDAAMAAFLLDAGAPVDGLDDDRRPLAQAIWYGCGNVRDLLLRRGAALDLELAAAVGRVDLLPAFFGADGALLPSAGRHREPVNVPIPGGPKPEELPQQALIYAAIGGSAACAAYLLDRGADVNGTPSGFDRMGAAALHWAAAGTEAALTELLLARGADLALKDARYGSTPLGWARHFGRRDMEALLLRAGAAE
ncbi:ankyrin repeat domain-containing protein [Paenibacillus sp. MWE-103]|uniref:Ankyrin repeat domain-containing protein n=1 Tax=Paenibacillus artemisiicola TaxID=1172618 RepID=A0ABS3WL87_9BACL|nr:ankyrin repeat domain-containing protein [Paenibacillus artemisiicola]MBO7748900.1 ankyrin repeat domain-containing protein [Paenibacillus artemisiicola]